MTFLYEIKTPDRRRYIGITETPAGRWASHQYDARSGSRFPIHRALRKWPKRSQFKVLVEGTREYILELEIAAIAAYRTCDRKFGFNVHLGGGSAEGGHSPETRAKMSASQKRRKRAPEELARMKVMAQQKQMTPEYREKLSQAALRRWADPEKRRALLYAQILSPEKQEIRSAKIIANNTGRVVSAGTKAKISSSAKANWQDDTKREQLLGILRSPTRSAKLSKALKGKEKSPEWRAKISAALTGRPGRPHSEETKAKIAAGNRKPKPRKVK